MKRRNLVICLLFILIVFLSYKLQKKVEIPLDIILSPHFDDGVFSLGGLMAQIEEKPDKRIIVATFFTKKPTIAMHTEWDKISGFSDSNQAVKERTKENERALTPFNAIIKNYDYPDFQYRKKDQNKEIENKIRNNIESILEENINKEIFIYGPATFGQQITHPDHQIVHDALMDVAKEKTYTNIHFFIYEDYPYIRRFNNEGKISLNAYLNKIENLTFEEKPITLNNENLTRKIDSVKMYKSQIKAFNSLGDDILFFYTFYKNRCENITPKPYACEVVYLVKT